jgi:type IV secretory pathway VirB4 component
LFLQEENYRTSESPFGFRLGDRLTGRPLHVDIDDEPKYYEKGAHILLIDVGHSYELQCALHGGYYFTYREDDPIRFNPFYLGPGDEMDIEKQESIKNLLLALWKKSGEDHNRIEYVALSAALHGYSEKLAQRPDIFPCFDTDATCPGSSKRIESTLQRFSHSFSNNGPLPERNPCARHPA